MNRKLFSAILALALAIGTFPITCFAAGADELSAAIEYVTEQQIFIGGSGGDLNLESGLTRVELAVLLVRLCGDEEKMNADPDYYIMYCYFTDVPDWAKPYVGYCAGEGLMNGYSLFTFVPNDMVTPRQACTVILRNMGIPETEWSYATAVNAAGKLGITPAAGFPDTNAVKRGEMAVLIHKASRTDRQENGENPGVYQGQAKVLDGKSYAREDFSAQANPEVFDDYYTRGIYNVVRQVMLDYDEIAAGMDENGYNADYDYPHVIGHDKSYYVINEVFGNLMGYHRYRNFGEPDVKNVWQYPSYSSATILPWNQLLVDVNKATDGIITEADELAADSEKVRYFSDYIRSRIIYDNSKMAGTLLEVFSNEAAVYGVCADYTRAFKYLCGKAGIPVMTVTSLPKDGNAGHAWNMVYVGGQWLYVDVTTNMILQTAYTFAIDENPLLTEYLKEILVPGSTK